MLDITKNGGATPETQRDLIGSCLDDSKAEDIRVFDLKGKTPVSDYMIIATGNSMTHVKSMAEKIVQKLKDNGCKGIKVEGVNAGDWVLVDGGDVIVHLFRAEVRKFYDLDKLWSECEDDAYTIQHQPVFA